MLEKQSKLPFLSTVMIILGWFLSQPMNGDASLAMKRLYEDLFTDYNRLILPVASNKTKVTVTLGLKLGQILDLNLKQQILSTNVWVEQTWHDYKLEWQPELYEGIDMIHVPAENIWIPDIVLFNNADGNYELTLVAKATVHYNGTVVWKPPTMFRSTCEIDVEYFPFDIQTCFLRFGSWTFAGDELELRHVSNKKKAEIGIDLSQFYKNVEWDIIDGAAYYNEFYYECCNESYPDITFKIVIRRKMLFYLVNLILPVALMTFMTVSVFYLPSDSNEKVTLSISILTSLIVFFLLMLEIIPASSLAVPLFGKYLIFTLVLVTLSACVSVYVLNIHHRSPAVHSMSPRARQIFLKTLPRILRLNQPDPRERTSLNRFRKKKIAQQMLNASANNKVYDLAQPVAASLNLIDSLNCGYNLINPDDDDTQPASHSKKSKGIRKSLDDDDEGRYFRRYVDDYIARLKLTKEKSQQEECMSQHELANGPIRSAAMNQQSSLEERRCCDHMKCCPKANQPLGGQQPKRAQPSSQRLQHQRNHILTSSCCGATGTMDWTESSGDILCPLLMAQQSSNPSYQNKMKKQSSMGSHQAATMMCKSSSFGCTARRSHLGMQNDDTLDMTFDYDDAQVDYGMGFAATSGAALATGPAPPTKGRPDLEQDSELPSPPPPPRQLAQLSCDSLVGLKSPAAGNEQRKSTIGSKQSSHHGLGPMMSGDNGNGAKLVDKLLSSINLINNASDDMDTTTTASNNEPFEYNANNVTNLDLDDDDDDDGGNDDYDDDLDDDELDDEMDVGVPDYRKSEGCVCSNNAGSGRTHLNGSQQTSFANQQQAQTQCACKPGSGPKFATMAFPVAPPNVTGSQYGPPPAATNGAGSYKQQSSGYSHDFLTGMPSQVKLNKPSDLLLSLRLPYDQMPAHVRAAIRSILFIADTIKNEDDENSAIEDWESMSMVVDRLFLWIFFLLCTFGSLIILAMAPSLYDQRVSIDDKLRIDIPPSNCSASVYAHS